MCAGDSLAGGDFDRHVRQRRAHRIKERMDGYGRAVVELDDQLFADMNELHLLVRDAGKVEFGALVYPSSRVTAWLAEGLTTLTTRGAAPDPVETEGPACAIRASIIAVPDDEGCLCPLGFNVFLALAIGQGNATDFSHDISVMWLRSHRTILRAV